MLMVEWCLWWHTGHISKNIGFGARVFRPTVNAKKNRPRNFMWFFLQKLKVK